MTALNLPVYDPARLAAALRDQGLPGQRSKTAITKLRRQRERQRSGLTDLRDWGAPIRARREAERNLEGFGAAPAIDPALRARLATRLAGAYRAEIARRGGETSIQTDKNSETGLAVTDRQDGLTLLHVDGWRYYGSSNPARPAALSYLCGTDDSGRWAARVPGTITTVAEAEGWITPADARKAAQNGKKVRRQGDIYAVETTQAHDTPSGWIGDDRRRDKKTGQWVTSHYWNAGTRTLVHRPEDGRKHRPLRLSYPVRFVQQQPYQMGRGAHRAYGD
jgi:hypothetical protein